MHLDFLAFFPVDRRRLNPSLTTTKNSLLTWILHKEGALRSKRLIQLELSRNQFVKNAYQYSPLRQNSCRLDRIFPGAVTKDGNGKVLGEIQSKSSREIATA